jgi:hypothetical protein
MKRNFLILVFLFVLLILPDLLLADCVPVPQFNNFVLEGDKTVILYYFQVPIVRFEVNCIVRPESKIRLLKDSVCDEDDIEIDGSKCSVITAKSP